MLLVNPAKLVSLREVIDAAVVGMSIEREITRPQAYVEIAKSLGYSIRAYSGNEGWSCVIAFARRHGLVDIGDRLLRRDQEEIEPLRELARELGRAIQGKLDSLERGVVYSREVGVPIDGDELLEELAAVKAQVKRQQVLVRNIERRQRQLHEDFASELYRELSDAVVVFGVSIEVAIVAALLKMLDARCDVFLTREEACGLYTEKDMMRRAGAVHRRCWAEGDGDVVDVLDAPLDGARGVLVRYISRLVSDFTDAGPAEGRHQ